MDINFFAEQVDFKLPDEAKHNNWIAETIRSEGKSPGNITIIFCNDPILFELNRKYLNHDTLTDIITFDYCEGKIVSGDVYISVDRVKENAFGLSIPFIEEIDRVMIHGVLHLLGYPDKTKQEKHLMREKEDQYLSLRSF